MLSSLFVTFDSRASINIPLMALSIRLGPVSTLEARGPALAATVHWWPVAACGGGH